MAADAGTIVVFRRNPTDRFKPTDTTQEYLGLDTWSVGKNYRVGETVVTINTGSTETAHKTWVSLSDRLSIAGDKTGGSATVAEELAPAYWWEGTENDLVYPVSDFSIDYPVTTTATKNLIDLQEKSVTTNGAPTIAMNFNDAADRTPNERLLGRGNDRIWIGIFRGGRAGAGLVGIKYEGYARVGASSISFPGGADGIISKTINFIGDSDEAFLEETYTGA